MAFKVVSSSPNVPVETYTADASTTFTKGNLCYRDTTTGEIKENTATTGDATNVEGIVATTVTTAASNPVVDLYPVHDGMRVIADCTNVTAANQLNKAHLLTNAGTVNNTSTHSTDINAVFVATRIVGAVGGTKLYGYIARLGQVTA